MSSTRAWPARSRGTITAPAACDEVAAAAGVQRLSLGPVGHACAIEAADAVCRLLAAEPLES
jgi:hypothetical protein